ncbi:MAG: beta-lactamase family protein [Firmicutes bacterium]|nr:beta-lactamase family protein [Bacillota bacterium]
MRLNRTYLADTTKITDLLNKEMERCGVPGITVAAINKGEIIYTKALGVKNTQGDPVTEDTLFEAASLTKTLFATMVNGMAERGEVDMDKPVMDVYQGAPWSDDPRFLKITPRHCFCHGAGLPNWAPKPMEVKFDALTSYSYSGEGYYLVQHMVEQMTGKNLDELLKETFLNPLGMKHSAALWTPEIGAKFSYGFDKQGGIRKIRDEIDLEGEGPEPNSAWSLYCNAFEMARFLQYIIQKHGGLGESQFGEMTKPQNWATDQIPWGLGWGLTKKDPNLMWHWGDNSGFKSLTLVDPKFGDALSIFTNSDNGYAFWAAVAKELTDAPIDDIVHFVDVAE